MWEVHKVACPDFDRSVRSSPMSERPSQQHVLKQYLEVPGTGRLVWLGTCGETPSMLSKFDKACTRARFVNMVVILTESLVAATHRTPTHFTIQ